MRNKIASNDYDFEGLMSKLEADYKDGASGLKELIKRVSDECSDSEWKAVIALVGWSAVRYYSSRPAADFN